VASQRYIEDCGDPPVFPAGSRDAETRKPGHYPKTMRQVQKRPPDGTGGARAGSSVEVDVLPGSLHCGQQTTLAFGRDDRESRKAAWPRGSLGTSRTGRNQGVAQGLNPPFFRGRECRSSSSDRVRDG